jgi:hypothetical protein
MKGVEKWLSNYEFLPPFMRDFHDQKDLFKAMHELVQTESHVSWVDGHCYVIDVFLWFMAKRGFPLQKTRTKLIGMRDIHADIKSSKQRQIDILDSILKTTRAGKQ